MNRYQREKAVHERTGTNKNERKVQNLNAKAYLEQLQALDVRIDQNQERLDELKLSATSGGAIRYDKDKVQTSIAGSKLETDVCRYVDLQEEINRQIDYFIDQKNTVIRQIQDLNSPKLMQILFKVYVQFKTVRIAAQEMKISYSYAVEIHKKALETFEKTYQNQLKPFT